ncbi:hypothetical protein BGZ82_010574 [Podila clonocystis]|nr:hypothetical protein BGZ82_010574 [Podila clonocystis]
MGALGPKLEETCTLQDGDHGFEVDSSFQKSAIMMKRMRSKSESKISEGEYRAGHDPGQEQKGHGHKRHLQDHWAGQEQNQSRTTNQQAVFTLPPPREDRGCVLCYMTSEALGNNIVLCDKCSRGFHQLCYSPTIDNRFVEVREPGWRCFACSPLGTAVQEHTSVTEDMSLTGDQVPKSVKESFLWAMRKADLVQFITRIESSYPALKLYPSRLSSPTYLTDVSRFIQASGQEHVFALAQGLSQLSAPASGMAPDYFTSHFQPTTSATPTSIPDNKATVTPFTFNNSNTNTPTQSAQSAPSRTSVAQTSSTEQHKKSASTGKESTEATTSSTGSNYNSVKALDLPPYEEMIFMAIADLREDAGSAPKAILDWVHAHYPVPDTFRASCGQAISKAAKKGRLVKDGALYKLKPGYNYPPKRLPRHTGGPRARSLSYNSGLPLNLQPLSRPMTNKPSINSAGFERMDMIMDTNVYNMLPNGQFQVQQAMVAPFTSNGMVVSSGQAHHAHPFKIGKPLVGDTEMVEALGVQPSLIGSNMSNDPQLVGLGVTSMNNLKQDARIPTPKSRTVDTRGSDTAHATTATAATSTSTTAPASFDTATVTTRYGSLESDRIHPFVIGESLNHQSNIDAKKQSVPAVLAGLPAPEPSHVHHDADPIPTVHVWGSGSSDTNILDPFDDHVSTCTGPLPTASPSASHGARTDE